MKINYKELEDKIYNYPTKYPEGFVKTEIDTLLKDYPNINMDKFDDAMMGNTCMMSENDGLIIYHCDILKALLCGIENRNLRVDEWD